MKKAAARDFPINLDNGKNIFRREHENKHSSIRQI